MALGGMGITGAGASQPSIMDELLKRMRYIWVVLLAMTGAMSGMLKYVVAPPGALPEPSMLPMLAMVALASAVASFVVPRVYYRNAARRVGVATAPPPGGGMPAGMFQGAARPVAEHPGEARRIAYELGTTTFVLSVALSESVALFGLATRILGFPARDALPFLVAGALLILVRFPTDKRVIGAFESAKGIQIDPTPGIGV